jgi:hypothetical protein
MFNFGKGLHKGQSNNLEKDKKSEYLISIPEKTKNNISKIKKSSETEDSKSKVRTSNHSILKIRSNEVIK